jgi:hypothetical protein
MKTGLITLVLAAASVTAAQAQPLDALLARDAAQHARIAADVAHERIDVRSGAFLAQQEGKLHRLEARLIGATSPDRPAMSQLRQAQYDMAGAIRWAEKHRAKRIGSPMDRMHLAVATRREAGQERLIAHEFRQRRLKPAEVGALEAAQARIAQAQFGAVRSGGESVKTARSIQDLQNLQDYAIRKDPMLS